ncbi:amino acid ABC transporter permease, partial [Salmonella enterica subsp. enterica serovar Enteritidis]|nr:amino acid ABC transporter permease [Salmonella enterica subsp. enterica serovar Enteritidis]
PPRPWTTARIIGTLAVAFCILAGIGLVAWLAAAWRTDFMERWAPQYWAGLKVTFYITVASFLIGAVLSIPVAYGRMTTNRFLSALAYGYVYFFRGTPLIAQTFLIYYG